MKKVVLFFLAALASAGIATAQGGGWIVTGTISDASSSEPIPFASVQVKGASIGASADENGHFSIKAPSKEATLIFSFIGYTDEHVPIKGRSNVNVSLSVDNKVLEEAVVTGMYVSDKRLFTGAATKIDAKESKLDGVADISRSLEGRAAGVSVQNVSGTFGTAPKIRVRGATSIYGSSKPLWVVDGVIMEDVTEVDSDALSSGDAATLISSAIAGLNSDDIESFQILKDGSATSIYGARAMAGVIVVTTKRGQAGKFSLNYTGEFTTRLRPSYHDFNIMNSQDQMGIYKELENSGLISFGRTYRASTSGVYGKMYSLMSQYDATSGTFGLANTPEARNIYLRAAEMRNTDWFDELFSPALMMNHSVSMSGGSEKAQYYTSFSVMQDPGWTEQSKVQRYTASVNGNFNIAKEVALKLTSNTSYRKQRAPGTLGQTINAVTGEVSRDFDINPYSYALNTSRTLEADGFYKRNYAPFNIHNELDNNFIDFDVVDLKFQGELVVKPIPQVTLSALGAYKYSGTVQANQIRDNSNMALSFRAMDDATIRDNNPWLYTDPDVPNSLPQSVLPNGGFYRETKYKMNSWDFRATAAYNDVYNEKHTLNVYGGMEINNTKRNRTYFNGVGMQYEMGYLGAYDYLFFKQSSEENDVYYNLSNSYNRDVAFFGTATYAFDHRYVLNGTIRYEGSNRLGRVRSARWLPTWNVSVAWNAHEEPWWENVFGDKFSHATLKASYSLTGDKPSVTNSSVKITSFNPWRPYSSDKESGLGIADFANPNLTYEKKHELNLGVDLGFLNNRLNVTFDWYKRNNYDLIGPRTNNGSAGVLISYENVASMKSSGEELSISSKNIVKKNFKWQTDLIFSHVTTKVTKLESQNRVIDMITGSGFTMEGYPYRALFSLDYQGLNESGIPQFINESNELTTSGIDFQTRELGHLKYEGPTDPTITGSFANTFSTYGFHVNIFLTYSFGNVVRLDPAFYASYSDMSAMPKEFKNRWTMAGDENVKGVVPAIADLRQLQKDGNLNRAFNAYNRSSARIADGDFIRLKEVSITYDFPKRWIAPLKLANLSLKAQATNLCLLYADKKLNGQDPEFINAGGVAVPMPKQFTFTLRFGF